MSGCVHSLRDYFQYGRQQTKTSGSKYKVARDLVIKTLLANENMAYIAKTCVLHGNFTSRLFLADNNQWCLNVNDIHNFTNVT